MMGFQSVIKFLFDGLPNDWQPQIGLAGIDKRALIWAPGNKPQSPDQFRRALTSPLCAFYGCTNRAYRDQWSGQHNQDAMIVWAGLDIDAEDNPRFNPDELAQTVARICPQASLRRSCGGSGLHAFFRLQSPVQLPTVYANVYTRNLTRPFVSALDEAGVTVCKSDSRMFWVAGGRNQWLVQVPDRIENKAVPTTISETVQPVPADTVHVMPEIRLWLDRFAQVGLTVRVGVQNPVNIGVAIDCIRNHGGQVRTKSGLTSRTGTNGYIDCGHDWISLWTYADGRTVWVVTDDQISSMV